MSSRLTLIAHAATPAVRAAAFPLDEGIDDAGRRESEALAGGFNSTAIAWTSPATRAVETARALGLDAKPDHDLRDVDLGRWAGRAFSEVEAEEPEAVVQWLKDPTAAPHGGESLDHLRNRVASWLSVMSHKEARIVAVTHPAVIRAAIVVAIEANPVSFWRLDIAPLSIVDLRSNGGRWTLRSIKT